jgi:hypothetical protein
MFVAVGFALVGTTIGRLVASQPTVDTTIANIDRVAAVQKGNAFAQSPFVGKRVRVDGVVKSVEYRKSYAIIMGSKAGAYLGNSSYHGTVILEDLRTRDLIGCTFDGPVPQNKVASGQDPSEAADRALLGGLKVESTITVSGRIVGSIDSSSTDLVDCALETTRVGSQLSTHQIAPEPPADFSIAATTLLKEFQSNKIAFDAKYTGKALRVTGVLEKIDATGLAFHGDTNWDIVCVFPINDKSLGAEAIQKAGVLHSGQRVTVAATYQPNDEITLPTPALSNCVPQ